VYFASKDIVEMLPLSWLAAMIMAAQKVAAKATNLTTRWRILLVLAMDFRKEKWLVHNEFLMEM